MKQRKTHDSTKLSWDVDEAADFLRIHRNTLLERIDKGEGPPAAREGRAYVLLVEDCVAYLRERAREEQRKRRTEREKQEEIPKRTGGGKRQPLPELPPLPRS